MNSFEHYEEWHRELCPLERRNGGKQEMLIMKLHGSEYVQPCCSINSVRYLSKSNISAQSHYAAKFRLLLDNFSNGFNCADEKFAPETVFSSTFTLKRHAAVGFSYGGFCFCKSRGTFV